MLRQIIKNLDKLEGFFDRLQNYISHELDVIPRLDDDEFDEMYWDVQSRNRKNSQIEVI